MQKIDATGRWRGILSSCGISETYLTGKHCPCPICGNVKDKFRFDDKRGEGTFYCNDCGAGNGYKLLMLALNISYKQAVDMVKPLIGIVEIGKVKPVISEENNKKYLNKIWTEAKKIQSGDLASRYLHSRELDFNYDNLRFIDKCKSSKGEYHPAMLAKVMDREGKPVTIHRTYLGENGKAETANCRELVSGGMTDGSCIRLNRTESTLGIAEGIETAMSSQKLFNIPCWASISATMLEKWLPPDGVKEVYIFGDNDFSFRGQRSAYVLAEKLKSKGYAVTVKIPEIAGQDWNDFLRGGGFIKYPPLQLVI
jgi:putative DNA primase/helicase